MRSWSPMLTPPSSKRLWIGFGFAAGIAGIVALLARADEPATLEYSLQCGAFAAGRTNEWTERARSTSLDEIYALPTKLRADGRLGPSERCTVRAARADAG